MEKNSQQATPVLPCHQSNKSKLLHAIGYIFRCVLAFACSYGFATFVFDSMAAKVSHLPIFLTCLVSCAFFSVMQLNKQLFVAGAVAIAAAATFAVNVYGGIKTTLGGMLSAFTNAWASRLADLGVPSDADVISTASGVPNGDADHLTAAIVLITAVFSALFVTLTVTRMRLLPILFTAAAVSSFIFYFGLCEDSFGFSLMLSSLFGCIALSRYDSVFSGKKNIRAALGTAGSTRTASDEVRHIARVNSAIGGFYGIFAAFMAGLIIIVPSKVTREMTDIPSISVPLYNLENRITAALRGYSSYETGLYSVTPHASEPRSTEVSERLHDGEVQYKLRSDTNIPIYLRSWTGSIYRNGYWHTVTSEQIDEYRASFGSGFSPELLTAELLSAVEPSLLNLGDGETVSHHPQLGYSTAVIHIEKISPSDNSLALPSYTDPRMGLLKYGSPSSTDSHYINFYEGIFAHAGVVSPDRYSVISALAHAPDEYSVTGIAELVHHFSEQYALIQPLRSLVVSGVDESVIRSTYEQQLDELSRTHYTASESTKSAAAPSTSLYSVFTPPQKTLAHRYVYEMTADERKNVHALMDNLTVYDGYVKSNYLTMCEGAGNFIDLAYSIIRTEGLGTDTESFSYIDIHNAVMAVRNYLSVNMSYTLTPSAPEADKHHRNAAEAFLFDTREGYCVQYATSAVMLLRALDIPTRYAEGYIASDFTENTSKSLPGSYLSVVPDSNAHAWIEVYYRGYGWVAYEVTAPFIEDSTSDGNGGTDIGTPMQPTVPTHGTAEPYPDDSEETSADNTHQAFNDNSSAHNNGTSAVFTVTVSATVILALAAVGFAVILRKRALTENRRRVKLLKIARQPISESDDAGACASELGDRIIRLLKSIGISPRVGELATDFAVRVDSELKGTSAEGLSDIIARLQAAEFSESDSFEGLPDVADYYERLYKYVTTQKGRIKAIYVKYFMRAS